jgi:hypothetical protein
MKNKFKNIIILGRSKKFIDIIKKIFPESKIDIYSWRYLKKNYKKKTIYTDLIFICGYDFKSQWYSYKEYYNININYPLKFIKKISKKNIFIIYFNTINKLNINSKKKYTLSRYEFAKKELSRILCRIYNNVKILNVPLIIDKGNNIDIFSSKFENFILRIMIYFNLLKTIKIRELNRKIINTINKINIKKKYKNDKLKPIFLSIPRSLLIDRFLRYLGD